MTSTAFLWATSPTDLPLDGPHHVTPSKQRSLAILRRAYAQEDLIFLDHSFLIFLPFSSERSPSFVITAPAFLSYCLSYRRSYPPIHARIRPPSSRTFRTEIVSGGRGLFFGHAPAILHHLRPQDSARTVDRLANGARDRVETRGFRRADQVGEDD